MNAPARVSRGSSADVGVGKGRYKLTRSDYLLLDEGGSFGGQKTELVDGYVFVMSPEWIPHMRLKDELAYRLRRHAEDHALALKIGTGASVDLSDVDQPRPDIIVMREMIGDKAIPRDTVLLLVEVSSTTLPYDLTDKASVYARAGVPEYWVADVNGRVVHQMWGPANGSFTQRRDIKFGDVVNAATITDLTVDTRNL